MLRPRLTLKSNLLLFYYNIKKKTIASPKNSKGILDILIHIEEATTTLIDINEEQVTFGTDKGGKVTTARSIYLAKILSDDTKLHLRH